MKISRAFLLILSFAGAQVSFSQELTVKDPWQNLPGVEQTSFRKDTINILSFNVKPDGQTLNTKGINDAITTCSRNGGGVVLIPGGVWLTGPIELKDHVNLHLTRGAILLFTNDFDQYKLVETNYEGKPAVRNQSPLSGRDLQNIAITGSGVIDGNGDYWRMVSKRALTEDEWKMKIRSGILSEDGKAWYPSERFKKGYRTKDPGLIIPGKSIEDYTDVKDFLRPTLVNLTRCKKVLLEGITFQNSPAWGLHLLMSEDIVVRNVNVKNPDYAQNGDGLDLESCRNVLIEGCTFDVGDDGICIKSGKDEPGRKRGIPTENVMIRNCFVYKGHGGFVVGSEMSGGARNIFVEDCLFMGTDKGIRFKTARGRGGVVENIFIRNIGMVGILQEAIYFDMYYFTKPPAANEKEQIPEVSVETPQIRNIHISNIVCNGADVGIFVRGIPEMPINNITMKNLTLLAKHGVRIKDAWTIKVENASITTESSDPDLYIERSKGILFDNFTIKRSSGAVVEINGKETSDILIRRSGIKMEDVGFKHGALKEALKIL